MPRIALYLGGMEHFIDYGYKMATRGICRPGESLLRGQVYCGTLIIGFFLKGGNGHGKQEVI